MPYKCIVLLCKFPNVECKSKWLKKKKLFLLLKDVIIGNLLFFKGNETVKDVVYKSFSISGAFIVYHVAAASRSCNIVEIWLVLNHDTQPFC